MAHFYGIYGIGAVMIIILSRYFNKNAITLFLGGYLLGSITEYITSFLVEVVLHAKWWDYSNNILNINGRVCLLYSIFWGILANCLSNFLSNSKKDPCFYDLLFGFRLYSNLLCTRYFYY